ncbi:MAG: HlyD family type I secretion periplasmic adaptor subunit [Hyphomicrobiales bacterium]|nr:HlyD family type I secretion periplasmic adaptor subunit [Hyphomicrobiales bacterium]
MMPLIARGNRTLRSSPAGRVDPLAVDFQPDAARIEQRPLPVFARSVVYTVIGLIAVAALWATFSKVDRVVVARGKMITVDPLIVVQPLETSVIRSIEVGVGDVVQAGAVLATLDPTFTDSQEQAVRERLASMTAEARRLEAEIYEKPFVVGNDETDDARYLKLQAAIYAHRRAEYAAALAAHDAEIARISAAIATNQTAQAGLRERLSLISEVESMRQELFRIDAGSRLNLLMTQLDRHNISNQLDEKTNQENELLQQLMSAREQRQKFQNNWIREAGERLTSLQQNIATAVQQLATAERRSALVALRAPADGVVLELGHRSIGSVAKEAEPLVTLVPRTNKIEAEVDIDSSDVARLRAGDAVRLKLDALPFQRHGTLSGTLRVITESSFQPDRRAGTPVGDRPDTPMSFFRGRIALEAVKLDGVPADFRLIPGMTVAAEINVGKRSIISYLLEPVVRLFDESLREP